MYVFELEIAGSCKMFWKKSLQLSDRFYKLWSGGLVPLSGSEKTQWERGRVQKKIMREHTL